MGMDKKGWIRYSILNNKTKVKTTLLGHKARDEAMKLLGYRDFI